MNNFRTNIIKEKFPREHSTVSIGN